MSSPLWKSLPASEEAPPLPSISDLQEYEWSDNESKKPTFNEDPKHWASMTLRFGKYKGKTLRQLVKRAKGRSYLRWLVTKELRGNQVECIQAALSYHAREKERRASFLAKQPSWQTPPSNFVE